MFQRSQFLAALGALTLSLTISPLKAEPNNSDGSFTFNMVAAQACLPNASATVSIRPAGQAEIMDVSVEGLPPDTDFNLFIIQVPKSPFGVSWYEGDILTDKHGRGHQQFVGRFSIETFSVAPGSAPAPVVIATGPFPDASINPGFNPLQMYHLGLWFNSVQDANAARCTPGITPFSGDHNASIQVLNTSNFGDDFGPLRKVNPSTPKP